MLKNIRYILIAVLFLMLVSCTTPAQKGSSDPITIVDALDRTVEFETLPERIVIGGNGSLMVADAVTAFPEGREKLVAYAKTDQGKGSFTEVVVDDTVEVIEDRTSVETIASYQPDVVLLKTYMQDLGNTLEELSIPVVYLNLETYEQYQQDITNLGILLGNTQRADGLLGYFTEIVDSVEENTAALTDEDKPSVLFAYYDARDGAVALKVPSMQWAQTEVIERAGGIPVWDDIELESSWTVVSFEQIAAWNPDIIFVTSYFDNVDDVKQILLEDVQWQQLEAVKNDQLFAFPMAFYSWDQPHTRWGITQLWVAHNTHPELFPDFDFEQEAVEFYTLFYGWTEEQYQEIIQPRLQGDLQ